MAKKSSTIYLEQKFWDIISEYQLSNHIDSRNDAIQLILHEWYILNSINHIEYKQSKSNDMSIIKIIPSKLNILSSLLFKLSGTSINLSFTFFDLCGYKNVFLRLKNKLSCSKY